MIKSMLLDSKIVFKNILNILKKINIILKYCLNKGFAFPTLFLLLMIIFAH